MELDKMMHEVDHIKTKVESLTDASNSMKKEISGLSTISRRIENKVFNGFGDRIDAINEKLDGEIKVNADSHMEIKKALSGLIKFIGIALVSIFVALIGVLGTVWTSGNASHDKIDSAVTSIREAQEEDHRRLLELKDRVPVIEETVE